MTPKPDTHKEGIQTPSNSNTKNTEFCPLKRVYSIPEAAQYLGMTKWGVRRLIYNGEIPKVQNGRRVLVAIEDMDRWIEENKQTAEQY